MNIQVLPGRYVIAVSGGVDSMALLHALQGRPDVELIVAHFDHGIRSDSAEDRMLVQSVAAEYGLRYEYAEGKLGPTAPEDLARRARYAYLHEVRTCHAADAIITAHHKGDVLETAVINIIRGTGRKGLSSLGETEHIRRPLLTVLKSEIPRYADNNGLRWREDSTNDDHKYLRNYIRLRVLPRLSPEQAEKFYSFVVHSKTVNEELDNLLDAYLNSQKTHGQLDRASFIMLPHKVALEVMAAWLRSQGIRTFDKKMLERCVRAAKIQSAGTHSSLDRSAFLSIDRDFLALHRPER